MEDWPLGNTIGKDYCCTTYWYAAGDQKDFFTPVPVADRLPTPAWKPYTVDGLIEAELLKGIAATSGDVGPQAMGTFGTTWSGGRHLWWRAPKSGEKLTIPFEASKAGPHEVVLYLTKSWDYGTFRLAVNGTTAARDVDLFSGKDRLCVPSGPISLGAFTLKKGGNILTVEVVGKHTKSPWFFFGLDGILLKKAVRRATL